MNVTQWNDMVGVGDYVMYRNLPSDEPRRVRTRAKAKLCGDVAVVLLEGRYGYALLKLCAPIVGES